MNLNSCPWQTIVQLSVAFLALGAFETRGAEPNEQPSTQEAALLAEGAAKLAADARREGDASRGAVVFHQARLTCTKCHAAGEGESPLGPDLAKTGPLESDAQIIDALLAPSKTIRKGFEATTIVTVDGETIVGIVRERLPDRLVLGDASQVGAKREILLSDIDQEAPSTLSLMPTGLANLLGSRREFLDLARYLMEIAEKGPRRAHALRPAASLLATPALPAYEADLDHAGLLKASDQASFERGEKIFRRVCANCHGTLESPGSLPISPRFHVAKLKNGADPLSMYRVITRGYGLMAPQTWMAPRQKYDVIHYIRETFFAPHNPSQYVKIDDRYLASLPSGKSLGPSPVDLEPWSAMDYGPWLSATYELGDDGTTFAHKGIAARLDSGPGGVARGSSWMVFDHDTLRIAGGWSGTGFIDFNSILFNGAHGVHPRAVGEIAFRIPTGPGWADPKTGKFDDPRFVGRDGRRYGPLPKSWGKYLGLYRYGDRLVWSYEVGGVAILESPGATSLSTAKQGTPEDARADTVIYSRTFDIARSSRDLATRLAPSGTAVALAPGGAAKLADRDGFVTLVIPAKATPLVVEALISKADSTQLTDFAKSREPPGSLAEWTRGGPSQWPERLRMPAVLDAANAPGVPDTSPARGHSRNPFAVDIFPLPDNNPWSCQVRPTGFDFFSDGARAALCTWDGDVWLIEGLDDPAAVFTWRRIAAGLFQPLGLKIVADRIYVGCRDQIVELVDLNGDQETDFFRTFNSDHQVTEHFHEFAMGLQTDAEGAFYYAKSARHGAKAIVPQHGTLLRVSPDGAKTEILATGFRAANGVCLNPDGTFFVTDQEGHWNPKNRVNWVEKGGFYGNMWAYHDVVDTSDSAMRPPLCWITNAFDRSPSELLWVDSPAWGRLNGALLNFSYGYGQVYIVPHEKVAGLAQGGMCELPIPRFPTGVMRGRFHPRDGGLYLCGMYSWAGNQTQPGGWYRIRATGKPVYAPLALRATTRGVEIEFSDPVDRDSASAPENYAVKTWSLKRTENYGSEHYDETALEVRSASLDADGRTVRLEIPRIAPCWCMEIQYSLEDELGEAVTGRIHNTIHRLTNMEDPAANRTSKKERGKRPKVVKEPK